MQRTLRVWVAALVVGSSVAGAQAVTVGAPVRLDGMQLGLPQPGGPEFGWGQTFRTPDANDTFLDTWSFWLIPGFDPNLFAFQFQIAEWSGTGLLGAPIFSTSTLDPSSSGTEKTFDVGVNLDPTKTYIAYINPDIDPSAGETRGVFFYSCTECTFGFPNPTDAYTGGALVQLQSTLASDGVTRRDLSDQPLATVYDNVEFNGPPGLKHLDAQFEATFTPTPEPGTLALFATGLSVLGILGLRRKRAR